ncbi:MAG: hypothetical protein QW666_00495 [Candidatus Woesearchaeota archaeon]
MRFTKDEKEFLKELVKRERDHFVREKKSVFIDLPLTFLKGGHTYDHFLEDLLKKLE